MIDRERGAGCVSGEYAGIRGAEEILLVRTLISRLGWRMVILILKGAISYARLSQNPSNAHPEAQYIPNPGVPKWLVIPVITMICPTLFSRIAGSAALMILTGPKKFVSNWSRMRVSVLGEAESSSTVPITASLLQQKRISILPNVSTASAMAAWH